MTRRLAKKILDCAALNLAGLRPAHSDALTLRACARLPRHHMAEALRPWSGLLTPTPESL